jgi:hypothetical protein
MDAEWIKRYERGYFDEEGHLRPEFVQRETMEELARRMAQDDPQLTRHQARRFFQHCRRIERLLMIGKTAWGALRSEVYKLDEAAADAVSKSPRKIPELFHDFVKLNVRAIKDERDFRLGFMRHFEALIAFGYRYFIERPGAD